MTYIDNVIALGCTSLYFVMHFGDERAYSVYNVTPFRACSRNNFWCRTMCRQHDWGTIRYFIDGVNKYDALRYETVNNNFVVHYFVIAVHRFVKSSDHPCQCFDRHLNASAESSR